MSMAEGDVIEFRYDVGAEAQWRAAVRVVEDTADLTALWWPAGTVVKRARRESRAHLLEVLARGNWETEQVTWWGCDGLYVIPRGAPFSFWPYRDESGSLVLWYVNLQSPLEATSSGLRSVDWLLDLVVAPDLSSWQWKDEDELVDAERLGLLTAEGVQAARAAGERALELVKANDPLFQRWAAWRPPPAWRAAGPVEW